MHADAYFARGRTHAVCQDYALTWFEGETIYAALADGCSSSPHTDVGARLLLHAAARVVDLSGPARVADAARLALGATGTVGLPAECLDATAILLTGDAETIRANIHGDGVVVARRRDGSLVCTTVEFPSGAPLYPSYALRPARFAAYLDTYGRGRFVTTDSGGTATREQAPIGDNGADAVCLSFAAQEFELVMGLSDGALSFDRRSDGVPTPSPVALADVLGQVLAVQNFAGAFLARRCRRFLETFCPRERWSHADDFSAVAIYCGAGR